MITIRHHRERALPDLVRLTTGDCVSGFRRGSPLGGRGDPAGPLVDSLIAGAARPSSAVLVHRHRDVSRRDREGAAEIVREIRA
jgi:hypothetical protein